MSWGVKCCQVKWNDQSFSDQCVLGRVVVNQPPEISSPIPKQRSTFPSNSPDPLSPASSSPCPSPPLLPPPRPPNSASSTSRNPSGLSRPLAPLLPGPNSRFQSSIHPGTPPTWGIWRSRFTRPLTRVSSSSVPRTPTRGFRKRGKRTCDKEGK